MSQQKQNKRREGQAGVKTLIATASIAATLGGWALLPANDPPAASATSPADQQPALNAPADGQFGSTPQNPGSDLPVPPSSDGNLDNLPQVQAPQDFGGFSNQPFPMARSHSSR